MVLDFMLMYKIMYVIVQMFKIIYDMELEVKFFRVIKGLIRIKIGEK